MVKFSVKTGYFLNVVINLKACQVSPSARRNQFFCDILFSIMFIYSYKSATIISEARL
jgi:hypothetical protein